MTECLFCRIAHKQVPSTAVHESDNVYAFLDICPIRPGHTQIVPRQHFAYYEDLPPDIASEIVHVGQRLARAMKVLYPVKRVAFLFTGGDVAHAHAHVLPMVSPVDITSRRYIVEEKVSFKALPRASEEELSGVAASLRGEMAAQV